MSYAQDTITSANAANALATVLDSLFVDAGWETLETLTPSGDYRNRVYKSNAADNQCGYDWYMVMTWTTIGTERYVDLWAGSDYNPTTKVLSHVAAGYHVESTATADSRATDSTGAFAPGTINASTYTPGTTLPTFNAYNLNAASNTNTQTRGFHTLTPSSAFAYWASITLDHVAVFTTVGSNAQSGVYSTLALDTGYAADTSFRHTPIAVWDTSRFGISDGLIGTAVVSAGNYRATSIDYSRAFGSKLPALTDEYEVAYAWRPALYVDNIIGAGLGWADTAFRGGLYMGEVIDLYFVYGGSVGDTVTIDGGTYVLTMPLDVGSVQPITAAVLVE